jgi:hypothetical protein
MNTSFYCHLSYTVYSVFLSTTFIPLQIVYYSLSLCISPFEENCVQYLVRGETLGFNSSHQFHNILLYIRHSTCPSPGYTAVYQAQHLPLVL